MSQLSAAVTVPVYVVKPILNVLARPNRSRTSCPMFISLARRELVSRASPI